MPDAVRVKIGRMAIKKFIIKAPYGTENAYSSGIGATIVLSEVEVNCTKSSPTILIEECNIKIKNIHRNEFNDHAERRFLRALRYKIRSLGEDGYRVSRIRVKLVQNYSPCKNCADRIRTFKKYTEKEGIEFFMTIEFANFYCHWNPSTRKGLGQLINNIAELKSLRGEAAWNAFLNDTTFVQLANKTRKILLARAKSTERETREKTDVKMLRMIRREALGRECRYDWDRFFDDGGARYVEINEDDYIIPAENSDDPNIS